MPEFAHVAEQFVCDSRPSCHSCSSQDLSLGLGWDVSVLYAIHAHSLGLGIVLGLATRESSLLVVLGLCFELGTHSSWSKVPSTLFGCRSFCMC